MIVDPEERGYFTTLSDYIHLNPVRAGLIGLDDKLFSYRWSSYPWYAARAGRPGWFEPARVLSDLGWEDNKKGRRAYGERMRERAVEERTAKEDRSREELGRGWCLGGASATAFCGINLRVSGDAFMAGLMPGLTRELPTATVRQNAFRLGA